jgi:hypothetical protein
MYQGLMVGMLLVHGGRASGSFNCRHACSPGIGIGYGPNCDRTTSRMRGSSAKIISGDSRRSENAQIQHEAYNTMIFNL